MRPNQKIIAYHYKNRVCGLFLSIPPDLISKDKSIQDYLSDFDKPENFTLVGISSNFKEYCQIVKRYK